MYRCLYSLFLILVSTNVFAEELILHVATNGRTQSQGSESDPFSSIQQARDHIRQLRGEGLLDNTSVNVLVHSGRYDQLATLKFTAEDSGTRDFPVTYRSVGGEVLLSGGIEIRDWRKPTDAELERLPAIAHEQVVCAELSKVGISSGVLHSHRLHQPMHACPLELFANQHRLPRSGWPNEGWAFAKTVGATSWKADRNIHARDKQNVWAIGFWEADWSSSLEPVAIDHLSNRMSLSSSEPLCPKKVREGARYRLSNVLGELDSPGEWFVDEDSQLLLYWPVGNGAVESVSVVETLFSIYDSEFLTLDGFRIESARSMNIEIAGGQSVCVSNCSIGQSGTVGVHIVGGFEHKVVNCEVACTGSSAIRIEAGNRDTLEPCDHVVENCRIHNFCQHYLGGRAAIALHGVGIHVTTNHIHDGPDVAIAIHGNEHLIENNEIESVCKETDDSAAIHLSFDPTYRGNIIRKNYVHNLGGFSRIGIVGIYLDDFASGTVVENNLLVSTIRGIAIGGGRDNRVEGNIIVNSIAPIQLDARGLTWASDQIATEDSRIVKLCRTVLENNPVYGSRYPELLSLLQKDPATPLGNIVRSNTFDCLRGVELHGIDRQFVLVENNRRVPVDQIAATKPNLRKLGIELLAKPNEQSDETFAAAPKYVGKKTDAE